MYDCASIVHCTIRHMQNDKNNKGSFKWIHLLTLKYLKIYKNLRRRTKLLLLFLLLLLHLFIQNSAGSETVGGRGRRSSKKTFRAGLAENLPAVVLAVAEPTGKKNSRKNGCSPVLLMLCSEAVRLIMEVPGGHDLWSVLRHQCSVLVKDQSCCRDREAQAQQAGEGQQQLPHGDG
jgi:hypothetical protein